MNRPKLRNNNRYVPHFAVSSVEAAKSTQQINNVFSASFSEQFNNYGGFFFYAIYRIAGFNKFKYPFLDGVKIFWVHSRFRFNSQ